MEAAMTRIGRQRASEPDVHRITGARRSLTDDIHSRQTKYLISMTVRTVCFILAVVTPGWWRAVFFVGALVLPYVSVVIANAGREQATAPIAMPPPSRAQIERGPSEPEGP